MQFQQLVQLSSTDNRFKELRSAMKKAPPPTVPYLGILLSEVSSVVEGLPTYLEDHLVNFSKMRRVSTHVLPTLKASQLQVPCLKFQCTKSLNMESEVVFLHALEV